MYALINPCSIICNMQLNVLNDLAEAMKALDRKKSTHTFFSLCVPSPVATVKVP